MCSLPDLNKTSSLTAAFQQANQPRSARRKSAASLCRAHARGEKAFLTYSSVRTIFGMKQINMPSEFLSDIDDALLEADTLPEHTISLN